MDLPRWSQLRMEAAKCPPYRVVERTTLRFAPWPRVWWVLPVQRRVVLCDQTVEVFVESLTNRQPVQINRVSPHIAVFRCGGPQDHARSRIKKEPRLGHGTFS